ncbi:MAG: hypothetical protein NZM31_14415 [Gemmatales bacterium]|nr:hypothetical protein [Gemmatales bacterium]MDW8388189.1 hypothetical protein [Gemmatales bacterium]
MSAWKPWRGFWPLAAVLFCGTVLNLSTAQEPPAPAGRNAEEITPPPGLRPFQHALFMSTRRAAEWLWNANRADGTFLPGLRPDLDAEVEDDLLRQIQGAYGLARSARFFASERYAVRARQAILSLLTMTRTDPQDASVRFTVPPSSQTNRLGAAALLVLAIHELPEPGADLLEQADQLANFLKKQQRKDGSFAVSDDGEESAASPADAAVYSANAILALARSSGRQAEPGRMAAARNGFTAAFRAWKENRLPHATCVLICAGAELHARTGDKALSENVCELADWLCTLQYPPDPRRPAWQGGFRTSPSKAGGEVEPAADSALCIEAVCEACRVVRAGADLQRFGRYRDAGERGFQFLTTLQYGPANTKHFAPWYGPRLYGAFHDSPRDGTIRLENTQRCLCALTAYFQYVIQAEPGSRGVDRPSDGD